MKLSCLPEIETKNYINYRVEKAGLKKEIFSDEAIDFIFENTEGVPRLINTLCDFSLALQSPRPKARLKSRRFSGRV